MFRLIWKKLLGVICWKISLSENSFGFIIDIMKKTKLLSLVSVTKFIGILSLLDLGEFIVHRVIYILKKWDVFERDDLTEY